MTADSWKIEDRAADWEADWEGSVRFRHRLFRSLSMADKVRAVEEMCRVARLLQAKKRARPE
jgi:hypothetical protein